MLEKIKANPRLVIATLITAGVLALIVGSGGDNKPAENTDKSDETTTSESTDKPATTDDANKTEPAATSDPIGSTPEAGPVEVASTEEEYTAVVRKGDNQTVIVRQMVNEYLSANSKTLGAEQRLYIETNLVNKLTRDDLVFAGEQIKVPTSAISELVSASESLTDAQKSLWAQYL
jgi:hypothetical protein